MPQRPEFKKIVIVSDGTGKTAKRLMDAVLAQYHYQELAFPIVRIYQEVRDEKTLDGILKEIEADYLVLYSVISADLGNYFHQKLTERGILHLNILEPMLNTMSKFLGVHPDYEPGLLQIIDDRYYRKVDAIGFTVEHDDGMGHALEAADVILLGVSRTCKTPISMYLACNHGFKVANIPIVADLELEHSLLSRLRGVVSERIVGLTMKPDILTQVREERSTHLVRAQHDNRAVKEYTDFHAVRDEIRYCSRLFGRQGWAVVDVTRRAIEEVSMEIIDRLGLGSGRE